MENNIILKNLKPQYFKQNSNIKNGFYFESIVLLTIFAETDYF